MCLNDFEKFIPVIDTIIIIYSQLYYFTNLYYIG